MSRSGRRRMIRGALAGYVAEAFGGLVRFNTEARGLPVADNPDGVMMACALWDGFILDTQACHAVVLTDDDAAYGQVVLYKEDFGYDSGITFDDYSFHVITETDSKMFKDRLIALLTG